ncbi:MAG: hypothetical protein K9J21_07100 [Bacteroidales bacterium]|nr:hypothetical protein [Bacteroidales bacterium]
MKQADYNSLIHRSNEINANKQSLNNRLKEGKKTIIKNGKRINIEARLNELDKEHQEIIKKINESHGTSI